MRILSMRPVYLVATSAKRWLEAHGAPNAWVSVAIQQVAGDPASNSREASAWFGTLSRHWGPIRASADDHTNARAAVARWGCDWTEDDVIDTLWAVVESAFNGLER
jgi:hypothetical protein